MLRSLISRLVVIALLLMSVEGAVDSINGSANPSGDEHAYHLDADHQDHASSEQNSDHCCHAHAGCVSAQPTMLAHREAAAPLHHYLSQWPSFILTPPTPPPNA